MLLPLKVLPGWPEPEPVSRLFLVMLCLVGPLALGVVVAAIGATPTMLRRGREDARQHGLAEHSIQPGAPVQAGREIEAPLSGANPDGSARRGF